MKTKYIIVFCAILYSNHLHSQIKFDYNWILGKPSAIGDTTGKFNGTRVDFNKNPTEYIYFNIHFDMDANASISDSTGNLLFYTNGCEVINNRHDKMENGDEINKGGWAYESNCLDDYPDGYPTHQGLMILPWPNRSNFYILPHLHRSGSGFHVQELRYSVIDMQQNGGLGTVVEKNVTVFQDTLLDMMTAVRHANGRGWWLVAPRYNQPFCYVFLISPEGISQPIVQDIVAPIENWSWGMQAAFSPNGKKYVNMYGGTGLQIFDFDRCTRQLSNGQLITFPEDTIHACGVAVSPNSRYLYASASTKLYQFDLLAPKLEQSRRLVGVYDGFRDPLWTNFYQLMLGPDGKIYMTCGNGVAYWHIIHNPDEQGMACDLEQHFRLPTSHSFSPPNFPHFRLFDLPDSPCDSLGIDGPQPPEDTIPAPPPPCAGALRLRPNPAAYATLLEVPDCTLGQLSVFDAAGRYVQYLALPAHRAGEGMPLDVSGYPPGVYFLYVRTARREVLVERLVVVR